MSLFYLARVTILTYLTNQIDVTAEYN